MRMIEAVLLSNALCLIENKNEITSKEIRLAVINNVIALMPFCETYDKKTKALAKEFSSEEVQKVQTEYNQMMEAYQAEKDEGKKKELEGKLQFLFIRIENLLAPFRAEKEAARERIDNEEVIIKLDLVKSSDFDAATEKVKLSIKDIIAIRVMFSDKND